MSENTDALDEAGRQLALMKRLVRAYENPVMSNFEGVEVPLSTEQVQSLVSQYTTAKAAMETEIDKVTG